MAAYIIYLAIVGIQSWYYAGNKLLLSRDNKWTYLTLCCIELIVLTGVRGYTVGADTRVYLDALEYYSALPKDEVLSAKLVPPFDFEAGYFLLTKLCAALSLPNPIFLMIVASITYIPIFCVIYRESKIPYVSILAYFAMGFFAYSLGIFRQMMALSITLCGLKYIRRRQPLRYLAVVALAMTFHTTAVAAVVIYVLTLIPLKKYIKWLIPAQLLCLIFGRPIVMLLVMIFPKYAGFVGGKYDVQGGTYLMLILLNILLFALVYLWDKGMCKKKYVIAALSAGVVIQALAYSMGILGRAVSYFSFYTIIAFSEIAYVMFFKPEIYGILWRDLLNLRDTTGKLLIKLNIKWQYILLAVIICGLGFLIFRNLAGNGYVSPYYFFFQKRSG